MKHTIKISLIALIAAFASCKKEELTMPSASGNANYSATSSGKTNNEDNTDIIITKEVQVTVRGGKGGSEGSKGGNSGSIIVGGGNSGGTGSSSSGTSTRRIGG